MINKKQFNILVWLVIVLLVLNVSALGTILWFRSNPINPSFSECNVPRKYKKHSFRMHDQKLREQVGFDDEQMEAFAALRESHFGEIREITRDIQNTRKHHFDAIRAETPEPQLLDSLNKRTGDLHRLWSESATLFLLAASDICEPEQRETLFTVLQEGHKRHFSSHHRPKGRYKSCDSTGGDARIGDTLRRRQHDCPMH
jgi:hypothetical protein